MQLNQLAYVLDYVDTSIHDTELLPAYAALIDALTQAKNGKDDAVERVGQMREQLCERHESIHPHGWGEGQMAILDSYEARALIGIPAIVRIQHAFIENFMTPKSLLAEIQALHDETLALAERVTLLLKGLDPVLTELPEQASATLDGETVEGELVEGNLRSMPDGMSRNPLALIKNRFPNRAEQSGALVRSDGVTLSTKLIAAAPVVLAAAGKALEVYRTYSDAKQTLAKSQAKSAVQSQQKPQQKIVQTQNHTQNSGYVRYSYSRSVYVYRSDE